jgi:hypothetical protein
MADRAKLITEPSPWAVAGGVRGREDGDPRVALFPPNSVKRRNTNITRLSPNRKIMLIEIRKLAQNCVSSCDKIKFNLLNLLNIILYHVKPVVIVANFLP